MKNSIIGKVPDYSQIRSELLKDLSYPIAIEFDEIGYTSETKRLSKLCSNLNHIISDYGKVLKYKPSLPEFKKLLLPLIVSIPKKEVIEKDLRTRWLKENDISVVVKGAKTNKGKTINFLLETIDFPTDLNEAIDNIYTHMGSTFVPVDIKYSDLYNEKTDQFEVSEKVDEFVKSNSTYKLQTAEKLTEYFLVLQLCDCLNYMRKLGVGIPVGSIPNQFYRLLHVYPEDTGTPTFAVKSIQTYVEEQRPQVEIIEGSIVDNNEYDIDGGAISWSPITFRAKVDGMVCNLRFKTPSLILPSYPSPSTGGVHRAIDIVKNSDMVAEILYVGASSIEIVSRKVE